MPAVYPGFSHALLASMEAETLGVVEEAFMRGASYPSLFDTRSTFVDAALARLYRVPLPGAARGLQKVAIPETSLRTGLLGHASFLALHARWRAPRPPGAESHPRAPIPGS